MLILKTVTDAHRFLKLPAPKHPLISLVPAKDFHAEVEVGTKVRIDLYQIWLKPGTDCEVGYGRNSFDFREGALAFFKAGQVVTVTSPVSEVPSEGWLLLFHPDLIRMSDLGKNIHRYGFFDYETYESLHVSEAEKQALTDLARKIDSELSLNLDRYSQKLIVSTLELLLDYSLRYYDRQFLVRTQLNQGLIDRFERELNAYFEEEKHLDKGLPSVKYLGEQLHLSPQYLSDLLKKETGKNAQEHIHFHLIEQAKNYLLGTEEPVSQIAYQLGFAYPQHFTKLFKNKTGLTPIAFRNGEGVS